MARTVGITRGPNFDEMSLSQREWQNGNLRDVYFVVNGDESAGNGIRVVITTLELLPPNHKVCRFEGHSVYNVHRKMRGTYDPNYRKGSLILDAEPRAMTVVLRDRSDDIHACVNFDPRIWGAGKTVDEALGSLLSAHRGCFGVIFIGQGKLAGKVGDVNPPPTKGARS
jgi:hypothetical protein